MKMKLTKFEKGVLKTLYFKYGQSFIDFDEVEDYFFENEDINIDRFKKLVEEDYLFAISNWIKVNPHEECLRENIYTEMSHYRITDKSIEVISESV